MERIKKAPHTNEHLNNMPMDPIICLIGDQAWKYYNKGKGLEWELIRDNERLDHNYKPIILDVEQLQNINYLQFANPSHQAFKFYQCGVLSVIEREALCFNLSKHTQAYKVKVPFFPMGEYKSYEDLNKNSRLKDLKNNEVTQIIADSIEPPPQEYSEYFKTLDQGGKTREFLKWLNSDGGVLSLGNGAFYRYNGKIWEALIPTYERDPLIALIIQFFKVKKIEYSKQKAIGIRDLLPYEIKPMGETRGDLLAFNNGILNKVTGELLPYDKKYYLTNFINLNYSIAPQETPYFNDYLNFISDGDKEKEARLLACLYMILTNRYDWQLFIEITGQGGTGKTIFFKLAQMLVGEHNAVAMPLEALDNPHALNGLINKMLIFSEDQTRYIGDGAILRTITGGGEVRIDPKYKDGFSYKVKAIYLMTNNTPLIFTEKANGTARRRVIFSFNKEVPEHKKIDNLEDKLYQELGGIIRKVLWRFKDNPQEAKRLLIAQRDSVEALQVKESTNPLFIFSKAFKVVEVITRDCLKMDCRETPNNYGKAREVALYKSYVSFHQANGENKPPMTKTAFKQAIWQVLKEQGKQIIYKRIDNTEYTNLQYRNMWQSFQDWDN